MIHLKSAKKRHLSLYSSLYNRPVGEKLLTLSLSPLGLGESSLTILPASKDELGFGLNLEVVCHYCAYGWEISHPRAAYTVYKVADMTMTSLT